ncbi:MAG: hypothetical protein LBH39_01200 [Clostridiales Family XIII bacterium]|nr:hypothetical protein [Clostridiales Family XIII bacterium]
MIKVLILGADTEYSRILGQRLAAPENRMAVDVRRPPAADAVCEAPGYGGIGYDFVLADADTLAYAECAFPKATLILLAEEEAPQTPGPGARQAEGPEGAAGCRGGIGEAALHTPGSSAGQAEGPGGARGGTRAIIIEKYSRASSMASAIKYRHAEKTGMRHMQAGQAGAELRFIGCFGLLGGCGASSVAIGIGRELASHKGRRALYISMETLESDSLCLPAADSAARNVSDFLYLIIKGRSGEAQLFLEGQLHCDSYGLERFMPSSGVNDLIRVGAEEREAFFSAIRGSGRFDTVILDLGSDLREEIRELMPLCDPLLLVDRKGAASGKAARNRELALLAWGRGGEKPVNIRNTPFPEPEWQADGPEPEPAPKPPPGAIFKTKGRQARGAPEQEEAREAFIEIGYDAAGFRLHGGRTDFVMSNEFGIGISKAVGQIMASAP